METLYRVDKMTFKDIESAERYERKLQTSLVTRINMYKSFYLPTAFKHYKLSLEKLKTAKANFKMKNYTSVSNLREAYEELFAKKRILRERIAEYRNAKALIRSLSATGKQQKNKKTESKK